MSTASRTGVRHDSGPTGRRPAVLARSTRGTGPSREDIRSRARHRSSLWFRIRPGDPLAWALWAACAVVLRVAPDVPALTVAAGLLLVPALPVTALVRKSRWGFADPATTTVVALGLVVVAVMGGALALDVALPALGIGDPLAREPVVVTALVAVAAVLLWRPRSPALPVAGSRRDLARLLAARWTPDTALAAAGLVVVVVGAVRLNNELGSEVAVVGRVLLIAAVAVALVRPRGCRTRPGATLVLVGAGLLLALSLRGWLVSGHDVQREYMSFQVVAAAQAWDMSQFESAYHACLSVNMLPLVITHLTGLSGVVVFKVVLQLLFALAPLVVMLLARTQVSDRTALTAAALWLAFPTFAADMPFLVRQEMAFLLVGITLLAGFSPGPGLRARRLLVVTLGAGVVMSHYSSTYVFLAGALAALAALVVLRGLAAAKARVRRGPRRGVRARRRPRITAAVSSLTVVHPLVVAALIALSVLWTGPVTETGGNLTGTLSSTVSDLVAGESTPGSADLRYVLPGVGASARERMDDLVEDSLEARDEATALLPPSGRLLTPALRDPVPDPPTTVGAALGSVVPLPLTNTLLRAGIVVLLQLGTVVGLVMMLLRRGPRPDPGDEPSVEYRWLVVGSFAALAAIVLAPRLSTEYGLLRGLAQALVLAAPVTVIGLAALVAPLQRLTRRITGHGAVAAFVVVALTVLGGVVSTTTGGAAGTLALSNSGTYHELLYVTDGEAAAYRWMGRTLDGRLAQAEVVSDKVAAYRFQGDPGAGLEVASEMFPLQLRQGTVVVLGPDTVERGTAAVFYTGTILRYAYPVDLVERRLDTIFANPGARILG